MLGIIDKDIFKIGPLKNLTQLPDYGELILLSSLACHGIYLVGGVLSKKFNHHYRNLNYGKQCSWCIHIVSFVFSSFIVPTAIPIYYIKENQSDRLLGSTHYSRSVISYTVGYFLWDFLISVYHIAETGPAFVFHASSCLIVFLLGFLPFAQGHGPVFLLFETSTVFLNIHWFCDKTGRSGSRLQWINGMFLLFTFFVSRLINGTYGMADFLFEAYNRRSEFPAGIWQTYTIAAICLGSLNFYWFSLMIKSVLGRFKSSRKSLAKLEKSAKEKE